MKKKKKNGPASIINTGHLMLLQPADAHNKEGRREYECVFMQPGRIKRQDQEPSSILIPTDTIKRAEPLFNSIASYLDHPELFGFGWHQAPEVKKLAGVTFDARWSDTENAMLGNIRLYDDKPDSAGALTRAIMDQILADKEAGLEVPLIGLSAVVFPDQEFNNDLEMIVYTNFRYIQSIDFVYDAGAGGFVHKALAAIGWGKPQRFISQGVTLNPRSNAMHPVNCTCPECVAARAAAPATPDPATPATPATPTATAPAAAPIGNPGPDVTELLTVIQTSIEQVNERVEQLAPPPAEPAAPTEPAPEPLDVQVSALNARVENLIATLATAEAEHTIHGMGTAPQDSGITFLASGHEQLQAAWDWVFGVEGADLPEPDARRTDWLYRKLSGDLNWSGRFDGERARQFLASANATTLADMTVNAMNKVIVPLYNRLDHYRWFERIVSVQPTDGSLQDMCWLQFGGIGDLPVVADGAAYTELTVADSKEADAFAKYGGYVGITEKALRNSDIARMQAVPRQLTISAIQTRSAKIANIFSQAAGLGPTLDQDSTALFDLSAHANYATTAFSWNAWKAARQECAKQTELGSSKRQGLFPRYGLFPIDQYDDALIKFGYGQGTGGRPTTGDNDVNPFAEDRPGDPRAIPIMVPDWTDVNNWYWIVDPLIAPVIQMAYADSPGGRVHPAPTLYVVTSPLAGLMFTNDTLPVKVKDHYAYGVATWRGVGGRVVS